MGWIFGGLCLAILIAVVFYSSQSKPARAHTANAVEQIDVPRLPQDADQAAKQDWFWSIVEASKREALSQDSQIDNLNRVLSQYSPVELETFVAQYDRVHAGAYSWDIWGAAYVMMGGCSDDCFHYFRSWMIANGRDFFESVHANPDQLAALIPSEYNDDVEFESYGYVAWEVWSAKTGKSVAEMPPLEVGVGQNDPSGEPFEESIEALSQRYPKLWERFGSAPLG